MLYNEHQLPARWVSQCLTLSSILHSLLSNCWFILKIWMVLFCILFVLNSDYTVPTPGRSVIMSGHLPALRTTPAGPSDRKMYRKKEYQVDRESAEYKEAHIYLTSILEEHTISDHQTTAKIITYKQ